MPLKHGNREGARITNADAAAKGRKGGLVTAARRREDKQRRADLMALFKIEPLSAELVRNAYSVLLAMNVKQLTELAKNENMPIFLRRKARLLLQQDDILASEVTETMLDRAFGKPKQALDMGIAQKPPITILPDEDIVQENE